MNEEPKASGAASVDYRRSHAAKGADYDSTLAASPFDAYMTACETHWLARFVERAYPHGVGRYLDFACGTGRITSIVAPRARESVGVDVSASMLEVARAKCAGARFVQADITVSPQFEPDSFDLVTAFRFLGNAQQELRTAALRAIARVLRPGGHLIVNSHRNPMSIAALLHAASGGTHGMDLHYFKLRRLLRAHGFDVVDMRAIGVRMIRSRMLARARVDDAHRWPERALAHPAFAPVAPDLLLIARKRASPAAAAAPR
jgi:SAM-dependent methyltransferase